MFDENEKLALVPKKQLAPAQVVIVKRKTNAELVLDVAKSGDNASLALLLERMTQLEAVNNTVKEVIIASRDLEQNYTIPGPTRFKRVVRLRKALDQLESRVRSGKL